MFSPDSRLMQILGRITDLILLNLLYLLCCLPIVTIGAATSALYTMCFRLMREEYSGIAASYFRALKDNFRQATAIWLLLLAAAVPACCYLGLLFPLEGLLKYSSFLFLLILVLCLMTASYVFPWISQFENTTAQALKNALLLSISRLPRTFAILAIQLVPVLLWFFGPELFLKAGFLWAALWFAAAAYMITGLLWHVFKPYQNP